MNRICHPLFAVLVIFAAFANQAAAATLTVILTGSGTSGNFDFDAGSGTYTIPGGLGAGLEISLSALVAGDAGEINATAGSLWNQRRWQRR